MTSNHSFPTKKPISKLSHLPQDLLLLISDYLPPPSLHSLSKTTNFWADFTLHNIWPRRLAQTLRVRSLQKSPPLTHLPPVVTTSIPSDSQTWLRLFTTISTCASARMLSICLKLSPKDSITSLALQFSISRQDLFRANLLLSEHQVASRTHLYIPLLCDDAVFKFTGIHTNRQIPFLVRDNLLCKYFLVVQFRSCEPPTTREPHSAQSQPQSYVRQLVVKLIAKGFAAEEHEVKFYLEHNHFDVAKAYKELLADHQFCP